MSRIPKKITKAEIKRRGWAIVGNRIVPGSVSINTDGVRPAKRRTEEFDHQATLFALLKERSREFPDLRFIWGSMAGMWMSKGERARASTQGRVPGVPDVLVPFARRGYGAAALELKSGTGATRPEQVAFHEHLRSEGWCVKITRTPDQSIEFLEWYLGIDLEVVKG